MFRTAVLMALLLASGALAESSATEKLGEEVKAGSLRTLSELVYTDAYVDVYVNADGTGSVVNKGDYYQGTTSWGRRLLDAGRKLLADVVYYDGYGTKVTGSADGTTGSVAVDVPYYKGTTTWGRKLLENGRQLKQADAIVYYEGPYTKVTGSADGQSGSVVVDGPYYSGTTTWGKK
jgi:hypothetical protein